MTKAILSRNFHVKCCRPRPEQPFCANPRSQNANGHLTLMTGNENVQITISVRHLQNRHVIGCCHHQHGLLHHVFLSSGPAPFLSSMHMFFPSFVFGPNALNLALCCGLVSCLLPCTSQHCEFVVYFFLVPKKMMSLTALSVCRGTPRLKFHGMKISARLFSLSPHLVLVYGGTYFLQMFVFFLGPSSRKKQCSDQPQRIPFFILAGTWMPPSYENIIAPPWFRFAKC